MATAPGFFLTLAGAFLPTRRPTSPASFHTGDSRAGGCRFGKRWFWTNQVNKWMVLRFRL